MKIAVIGIGYVGLSLSVLLSQENDVVAVDILEQKVRLLNNKISPVLDILVSEYLSSKSLNLVATTNLTNALIDSKFVIICTPTNYDDKKNYFDTASVDFVIDEVSKNNSRAIIVIKSTVPLGYTNKKRMEYPHLKIIFSPEFLREGKALYDNLHPSRIIIGDKTQNGIELGELLLNASIDNDVPILYTNSSEAEAIKLFSNTYLAMRISFFNELDTYAELKELNSYDVIKGVSMDPRIGDYYNNPSFGYGGYCLPKDSKQLLANYKDIPQEIISAIVKANLTRKQYIANAILSKRPKSIGIYRLSMKSNSDNFRNSSILGIIDIFIEGNINVYLFEPGLKEKFFMGIPVIEDFEEFSEKSEIIVANRYDKKLNNVVKKVYTRDLFNRD